MPSDQYRDRYDTKHTVIAPGVDDAHPVVVKAQWVYDKKNGQTSDTGRLGTLQPSEISSDSEQE